MFATTTLNVVSMAKIKYQWLFAEPFLFGGIVYLDEQRLLAPELLGYAYVGFLALIVVRYLGLISSVVVQVTQFLGVGFFSVAPAVPAEKKTN